MKSKSPPPSSPCNLVLKVDQPDRYRDGHRALARAIPSAKFYSVPKWLNSRCRSYSASQRPTWTDSRGKTHHFSPWPARYIREEFDHLAAQEPWCGLFDHWGRLTLDDGRVALFSCPYLDDYAAATAFAEAVRLELLSDPGDLSQYGYSSNWYFWAEPITENSRPCKA